MSSVFPDVLSVKRKRMSVPVGTHPLVLVSADAARPFTVFGRSAHVA